MRPRGFFESGGFPRLQASPSAGATVPQGRYHFFAAKWHRSTVWYGRDTLNEVSGAGSKIVTWGFAPYDPHGSRPSALETPFDRTKP